MLLRKTQQKKSEFSWSKKILGGALLGVVLGGMVCSVSAQELTSRDAIALQNQIAALKSQISQLQQAQSLGGGDSDRSRRRSKSSDQGSMSNDNSGLLPDLLNRVNNLEDQQRTMRGQLDDLTNQFQTKINLLNKKIDDMNFAAGHGGDSGSASTSTGKDTAEVAAPEAKPKTSSVPSLKEGQQALESGNYTEAESIARGVLDSPQGGKSVPAHFLLAQSLAGQKRYKDASLGYFDIYRKFPSSTRAPEALLGVSISLMKNGDNKAACQALGLLNNKYPSASARIKKAAASMNAKAKCS
ncbi:tol-pal system YbgF family protein [Commensalibacter oyaizuii]|uniref:Cell division coordinator CpoB n=1 Tax=Commensalibacter oyaizuii TaxID=3043873 RepID=A0ABT6PZE3_9PROT|nr:hypothetical protein [Commensalibacter sp. TBRC 16381]MDI2089876.1 hypothetical protein [Commensalibacter sp. TBRC 16381]